MQDQPVSSSWLHGLEPLVDRRRSDRRVHQRRSGEVPSAFSDQRSGEDRRLRERRETVSEHLRNALQVLLHTMVGRNLPTDLRYDIDAAVRRVWLALQEVERLGMAGRLGG